VLPNGLPAGDAVATGAGRLGAKWVIHTVGPVHSAREDRSEILASCYRRSLEVATELGAVSIAFPAISAGVYGWPMDDAARIATLTSRHWLDANESTVQLVRFVLFSSEALELFSAALDE
jgi:O-acetyl-ADP-ribose deacetylase (regulator of RNase III)